VKRQVAYTGAFERNLKRFVKRNPSLVGPIKTLVANMGEDVFELSLKTHKLQGRLAGSFSCSGGFDLRIVFRMVKVDGIEVIQLVNVGTHEDVY
jgi:mRNA interferase YafQ